MDISNVRLLNQSPVRKQTQTLSLCATACVCVVCVCEVCTCVHVYIFVFLCVVYMFVHVCDSEQTSVELSVCFHDVVMTTYIIFMDN